MSSTAPSTDFDADLAQEHPVATLPSRSGSTPFGPTTRRLVLGLLAAAAA